MTKFSPTVRKKVLFPLILAPESKTNCPLVSSEKLLLMPARLVRGVAGRAVPHGLDLDEVVGGGAVVVCEQHDDVNGGHALARAREAAPLLLRSLSEHRAEDARVLRDHVRASEHAAEPGHVLHDGVVSELGEVAAGERASACCCAQGVAVLVNVDLNALAGLHERAPAEPTAA